MGTEYIHIIETRSDLDQILKNLIQSRNNYVPVGRILKILEEWSDALNAEELKDINGLAFLRLWLRMSTLESLISRELGEKYLHNEWESKGMAQFKYFPVGLVGHWPAANIEIQPLISMVCSLLGGNSAIVRIPSGIISMNEQMISKLYQVDQNNELTSKIAFVTFAHDQENIHKAIAENVDGAMIWGGEESVLAVRNNSFPHWCRIAVFGPRISIAFMDSEVIADTDSRRRFCQRITRDVWQFDQMACSSPQVIFVEGKDHIEDLINDLEEYFIVENKAHPRIEIEPSLASNIALSRANWLMVSNSNKAVFPYEPDWTILLGESNEVPDPVHGKTLYIMQTDKFEDVIENIDGNVQTIGLAFKNIDREINIVEQVSSRGVDRLVKLGRMHIFDSPWDGRELVKPMVRKVRYVSSIES